MIVSLLILYSNHYFSAVDAIAFIVAMFTVLTIVSSTVFLGALQSGSVDAQTAQATRRRGQYILYAKLTLLISSECVGDGVCSGGTIGG